MEINELVVRAQNGDSDAFGLIYDSFARRIFRYIRIKINDRQEAEDILQEVFVKAYKGLGQLKAEDLNFSAWLYRIAGNTVNDHFRKKYRTPDTAAIDENFDLPDSYSLEKEAVLHSDLEIVRSCLGSLPPLYKQVLELR